MYVFAFSACTSVVTKMIPLVLTTHAYNQILNENISNE